MSVGRHYKQAVIATVNLKGGTGKTNTAVFFAHVLHEQGRSVLLVDADPTGSAASWNDDAPEPFPFRVVKMASADLHEQLPDITRERYNAVIIDTPPLEQRAGIVMSALRAATLVVVPVAPTPTEYKRLAHVRRFVETSAGFRADGQPVPLAVLQHRAVEAANSTAIWREQMQADGLWVLRSKINFLQRYSQADGDNIINASASAYGDAVAELLEQEVVA